MLPKLIGRACSRPGDTHDDALEMHRRGTGSGARRPAKRGQTSRGDAAKVREWAQSQGIEVSSRGRIPADLMEQYQAAH